MADEQIEITSDISLSSALKDLNNSIRLVEKNTRASEEEEKHVRRQDGQQMQVSLRIGILGIEDIDTIKQEFTCEFFLAAIWRELNLRNKVEDDEIDWDKEWDPRIIFANAVEIKNIKKKHCLALTGIKESNDNLAEDEDCLDHIPFVQLSYRVKGRFKSLLNLKNFPFDFQTLSIVISSDWSEKVVILKCKDADACTLSLERLPNLEEWQFNKRVLFKLGTFEEKCWRFPMSFSTCTFMFQIHRKSSYFINNIVILMFMITMLSFAAFAVDRSQTGERLSVSLTLLLTAVAFKFVVAGSLPPVSYMTILDRYIFSCFIFIFLVTVEISVASWAANKENWDKFERYSIYVAIALFILMHAWFLCLSLAAVIDSARNKSRFGKKKTRFRIFQENCRLPGPFDQEDCECSSRSRSLPFISAF